MEIAIDDADHQGWRAEIVGLVDEWRTTADEIDLRDADPDADLDLEDELEPDERQAASAP